MAEKAGVTFLFLWEATSYNSQKREQGFPLKEWKTQLGCVCVCVCARALTWEDHGEACNSLVRRAHNDLDRMRWTGSSERQEISITSKRWMQHSSVGPRHPPSSEQNSDRPVTTTATEDSEVLQRHGPVKSGHTWQKCQETVPLLVSQCPLPAFLLIRLPGLLTI